MRGSIKNLYNKWSKEFLEAGKQRLAGDTNRQATSDEVKQLRREMEQLKLLVAELSLKNRVLKKKLTWTGGEDVGRLIRRTQEEKMEIIHLVEHSSLPIRKTLTELDANHWELYHVDEDFVEKPQRGRCKSRQTDRNDRPVVR